MKRFFKILALALLVLSALVLGVAVFIRFKYPPERVKQILLTTLSQEYGMTVRCERLAFNLFSGFVLEKIALVRVEGQRPATPADFLSPLSIEKINFSYRWRSLLARRLEIDEVTISRPSLRYWQAPDSTTNLDAWLAAFTDSAAAADSTTQLPISINLKKLRLHELNLRATILSAVDTQSVDLDRFNAEVSELEVDRHSRYRAQFSMLAESAPLAYRVQPVAPAQSMQFDGLLSLQSSGKAAPDSLRAHFDISLQEGQWVFAGQKIVLPAARTSGEIGYDFASAKLAVPALQLQLVGAVDLAGSFAMASAGDTAAFEVRVQRGELNLDGLSELLHAHRHLALLSDWQSWRGAGKLQIADSYFRQNGNGLQYRGELKGEDIAVSDSASRLALAGANLELTWQTAMGDAKSNDSKENGPQTAILCQVDFAACVLPLDAQNVLATGPASLHADLFLTPEYLPHRGDLELNWRNFSGGNLHGRASFAKENAKPNAQNEMKAFLQLELDSLDLSPLTAGNVAGHLRRADFKIEGERLETLHLTGTVQNDALVYYTEESFGKIPPYHVQLSSQLNTNAAFSRFTFSEGTLRMPPAQGNFQGWYDVNSGVLRLDLSRAQVAIFEIMRLLPQDIVGDTTFPFISGSAQGQGWLESRTMPSSRFEYGGKFFARSADGVYADTSAGIYAEDLQIESSWTLATDSTTGDYRATAPALRLEYLPAPLPPAHAGGKIVVFEDRFLIKEGRMEIPAWSVSGNYSVSGKFLPQGIQVTTAVDAGMAAPEKLVLGEQLSLQGDLKTRFVFDQYLPDDITAPQPARIAGSLDLAHVNLAQDSTFAVRDLNVHANFAQEFDLRDFSLPPAAPSRQLALANANEALLMYEALGRSSRENQLAPSHLTLKELQFRNYQFKDIAARLMLGEGRLDIPEFRMNLFDGNLVGNILIGLGDGNPDNLTYSLSAQASSIDVSHLRRLGAQVEKGSKLSADLAVSGAGASSEKMEEVLANLAGALNISTIEGKAASNLLQALDPQGTDVGVQRMRLLLKTGWNVKTMKFEIKNGFVYASVSLVKTKPWTALFNLPPKLDFARFPLRYFIQTPE